MDKLLEKSFSEFLETQRADRIFDEFQDMIRAAYLDGYRRGQQDAQVHIVYVASKKRAED